MIIIQAESALKPPMELVFHSSNKYISYNRKHSTTAIKHHNPALAIGLYK